MQYSDFWFMKLGLPEKYLRDVKWLCNQIRLAGWLHNLNSQAQAHPPTHPGSVGVLWKSVAYLLCALRSYKQDHVRIQLECFLWVTIKQTSELLGKEIKPPYP